MILLPLHWPGLRGQFTPVAVTSFAPPKHILPTSPFFPDWRFIFSCCLALCCSKYIVADVCPTRRASGSGHNRLFCLPGSPHQGQSPKAYILSVESPADIHDGTVYQGSRRHFL